MDFKARLHNKAFWVSLIALIMLILKTFKIFDVPEDWENTANVVLSLLVTLGVLIDPTSPGILDKP
jgi:uncharacterized membrane protein